MDLPPASATHQSISEISDSDKWNDVVFEQSSCRNDVFNNILTLHSVDQSPSNVSEAFETHCLSPINECLKGFQHPFFCNEGLVKADWNESLSQNLPKQCLFTISSVCAFHNFGVCSLECVQARSNERRRVHKCKTCPPEVTLVWSVSATSANAEDDLWRVTPTHISKPGDKMTTTFANNSITTTNLRCQCAFNQIALEERKSTDQVSFNFPHVRKIVFNACDEKTAAVCKDSVQQLEMCEKMDAEQLPHPSQGHKIVTQLQTVRMFCLLQCECDILPQHMEEFANLNPNTSVALQGDNHNQFFWLFAAFPISSPQH